MLDPTQRDAGTVGGEEVGPVPGRRTGGSGEGAEARRPDQVGGGLRSVLGVERLRDRGREAHGRLRRGSHRGEPGEGLERVIRRRPPGLTAQVQTVDVRTQAIAPIAQLALDDVDPLRVDLHRLDGHGAQEAAGRLAAPVRLGCDVQHEVVEAQGAEAFVEGDGGAAMPGDVEDCAPGSGSVSDDSSHRARHVAPRRGVHQEVVPGGDGIEHVGLSGVEVAHATHLVERPVTAQLHGQWVREGRHGPLVAREGGEDLVLVERPRLGVEVIDEGLLGVDEGADEQPVIELEVVEHRVAEPTEAIQGRLRVEAGGREGPPGECGRVEQRPAAAQRGGEHRVDLERRLQREVVVALSPTPWRHRDRSEQDGSTNQPACRTTRRGHIRLGRGSVRGRRDAGGAACGGCADGDVLGPGRDAYGQERRGQAVPLGVVVGQHAHRASPPLGRGQRRALPDEVGQPGRAAGEELGDPRRVCGGEVELGVTQSIHIGEGRGARPGDERISPSGDGEGRELGGGGGGDSDRGGTVRRGGLRTARSRSLVRGSSHLSTLARGP